MLTRRHIVLGAAACSVVSPALTACASRADGQAAALALRRPLATANADRSLLMRELVR